MAFITLLGYAARITERIRYTGLDHLDQSFVVDAQGAETPHARESIGFG